MGSDTERTDSISMTTTTTPPEGNSNTPAGQTDGQAPPAKTVLETKIEAAKLDPKLAYELLDDLHKEVKSLRREAQTYRQNYQEIKTENDTLKKAEDDRKLAEMDEATKAKTMAEAAQKSYETERQARLALEAKLAFKDAGAQDIDSAILHWQAQAPEVREKTTVQDFATQLKEQKPHLFAAAAPPPPAGPNPRDGRTPPPGSNPNPVITHPQTAEELRQAKSVFRQ